jgi:hypothetical protein
MPEIRLLDPEAAANFLSVPVGRLEDWRAQGTGPAYIRLAHKTIRYSTADLIAFIQSRRQQGAARHQVAARILEKLDPNRREDNIQ